MKNFEKHPSENCFVLGIMGYRLKVVVTLTEKISNKAI